MKKSYCCHEADPHIREGINMAGCLLTCSELDRYHELIPDNQDCQVKWESAIDDPKKYVSLLVGQMDDNEQRAEADK